MMIKKKNNMLGKSSRRLSFSTFLLMMTSVFVGVGMGMFPSFPFSLAKTCCIPIPFMTTWTCFLSSSTKPPDRHSYGIPSLPSLTCSSSSSSLSNNNNNNNNNDDIHVSSSHLPMIGLWKIHIEEDEQNSQTTSLLREIRIHIHSNESVDVYTLGSHLRARWSSSFRRLYDAGDDGPRKKQLRIHQLEFKRPPSVKHWWKLKRYVKWIYEIQRHGLSITIPSSSSSSSSTESDNNVPLQWSFRNM